MMEIKANSTAASDREIVISRVFDAPRELVWKAWTDPKHVVNWWGPKGFSTTIEVTQGWNGTLAQLTEYLAKG